jgi:hypothetical protein
MDTTAPVFGARLAGTVVISALAVMTLVSPARAAIAQQTTFPVTGTVAGLYPGATLTLDAHVSNPFSFAIVVSAVGASALDASAACPASMLTVDASTATVQIAAGGSATLPLNVGLARVAGDACQSATFPLAFTAVGAEPGVRVGDASATRARSGFAFTGANITALVGAGAVLVTIGLILRRRASGLVR